MDSGYPVVFLHKKRNFQLKKQRHWCSWASLAGRIPNRCKVTDAPLNAIISSLKRAGRVSRINRKTEMGIVMVDMDFLKKFIPFSEMAVIRKNLGLYREGLEWIEGQLRSLPTPKELAGKKLEDIHIWAHYFGGPSDWWVYALEPDCEYAEAFVCLNGDSWNAETGTIYIPELLPISLINLDLYWNVITLKDVMDTVKGSGQ